MPSGNGERHKALDAAWHRDVPAGRHAAVPPSLEAFAVNGAGRMREHGGGN